MILGIVGHAQEKFNSLTENAAREEIDILLAAYEPTLVVSGACHMGGVDKYAIEGAERRSIPWKEFPPKNLQWSTGYKPRNIQIAEAADLVVSIVVTDYPEGYTGIRFPYCYHCKTNTHIKSGGCWTVKYAKSIGKQGSVIEIYKQ